MLRALALCLALACASGGAESDGAAPQVRSVEMRVTETGFEPARITLERGVPVRLLITRTTENTCAREIVIDEYGIETPLPLHTAVAVEFTPTRSGELRYGCAMGKMVGGVFLVE